MSKSDTSEKKTWEERKKEIVERKTDMFFTEDTLKGYLVRAGFSQKSNEIADMLNEAVMDVCIDLNKKALIYLKDKNGKSLRREEAVHAIQSTPVIPKGSY